VNSLEISTWLTNSRIFYNDFFLNTAYSPCIRICIEYPGIGHLLVVVLEMVSSRPITVIQKGMAQVVHIRAKPVGGEGEGRGNQQ
jgi:hypothetical protein